MYFEDMSNYAYYLKTPVENVKNIGWLDAGRSYRTGHVSPIFLRNLTDIIIGNSIVDAQVNKIRSTHRCSLSSCEVGKLITNGKSAVLGAAEVWIPSVIDREFFAAPTMIFHYIEKHNYLPQDDFISAVIGFDFNKKFSAQDVYLSVIKGHF